MILAIDNLSQRYHFARTLFPLVVASCPNCVFRELKTARAVLLNYDLDPCMPCPLCSQPAANRSVSAYTTAILNRNLPVIVVSCFERKNIQSLRKKLKPQRPIIISVNETNYELKWLNKLTEWQAQW